MSDDLAHDAHLRAALRHAPDHALSPPSGLTQSILTAARRAREPLPASPAPPPMRMRVAGAPSLRTWLHRLLSPRWAGAWAAALVAALGLGLWLDLAPEPAVESPAVVAAKEAKEEAPTGTVGLPAKAAPVAPAPAPSEATQARSDRRIGASLQAPGTAGTVRAQQSATAQRQNGERPAEARAQESGPQAPPARDATEPADNLHPNQRAGAAAPSAKRSSDSVATRQGSSEQGSTAVAAAAAPRPAPQAANAADEAAAGMRAAQNSAKLNAMRAETALRAARPETAMPPALLSRAQSESMAGTARWTWSAPGRPTITPFDAAAQAWLARVLAAAEGRWREGAERSDGGDALEVRWWRDGWPDATLRIESAGVRWLEPGGRSLYAPLDAATLQQLRNY